MLSERDIKLSCSDEILSCSDETLSCYNNLIMLFEQDDKLCNKILSRSNNTLSCRDELINKTRMSFPGFRRLPTRRLNTSH